MFELFGENAPQFILQLAIALSKSEMTDIRTLWKTIFTNWTIASSLFGLIIRSTAVYVELASKDKHNAKVKPYCSFKTKLIVVPLMIATVIPRVLTYAIFFGSSFPLFRSGALLGF